MSYHCSAVNFPLGMVQMMGEGLVVYSIINVILSRKNFVLSFEQGLDWVLLIFS